MFKRILTLLLLALAGHGAAHGGPFEDADAAYASGDHVTALRLYRGLAQEGNPSAQFNLGIMHDFGQGAVKDAAEAVRWYRAAAAQGHGGAQFNLGGMYFEGLGVPRDPVRAYMWFALGATAGAPGASRNRSTVGKMLSPAQLEQAQELVRACQARNFQGCD